MVAVKLQREFTVSERRACRVLDQPRASHRYAAQPASDETALVARILELVRAHPRYGYRFMTAKLRQEGWHVNAKRIYRLWRREGLKVPKKKRKRRRLGTSENACHRRRAERPNHVWCWDFIFDQTAAGSQLKWLSIEDEFTRESLALKVDRSFTSEDVIDTLAELFAMRGVPAHIRSDNGPEFIARAIGRWLTQLDVETLYIEPGRPGRTATPRASTAASATSAWPRRSSRTSWQPGGSAPIGDTITTITGRTARWGTGPQSSSRPAGLLPLRSVE